MIAARDLGRNRRRTILTVLAVGIGLALLVFTAGLMEGAIEGALANNIRLQTGHLQIRAATYEEEKTSLEWEDLLEDPQALARQIQALDQVQVATPVLWASGILGTREEAVGVRVFGIEPLSEAQAPFREGLVAGQFLEPDDRSGILLGKRLADSLDLTVGQDVSLLVNTSDEQPDEARFTIRGLYTSGVPSYDEATVFLPLAKAQAFTRTPGRASAIFVLLHERDSAETVAAALSAPQYSVPTWQKLNELLLHAVEMSAGMMSLIYIIVLAVVAVVIANTLLMAVFERTREMGILSAVGMKGRQILLMFLLEAGTLAVLGIVAGLVLGGAIVAYVGTVGWDIDAAAAATSASMGYGKTIYTQMAWSDVLSLSVAAFVITLLASLYPAWFAARLEPIDALRAQ
jgi:ABC-type lipoprotein release transport system permease subunit